MTTNESAVSVVDFEPRVIEIGNYDATKYNVLIRGKTLVQTNPFLRPVVREVALDQPGDTYPITQRKQDDGEWVATEVGISAVGLFVLADNASVVDVPQASGRVDDGRDPGVCTYRATIAMRMPDGEWTFRTRECTVKLATLEKEITAQKTAKAQQYKWSETKLHAEIAKELLLKEKFMERLAETGAKTRAIRAIFGIRTKYTPAEVRRPFVFAAVVQDMSQPELRARMLDQATSAIGAVFGPTSGSTAAAPRQLTAGPAVEDLDEADAEPTSDEAAGEITQEELGAAAAVAREPADAGTGDDVPDWAKPTATGDAPAAEGKKASKAKAPTFIERLRDNAESSGMAGEANEVQRGKLRELLGGFDWPTETVPVLVAAFGDEAARTLSAAQAQAIVGLGASEDDFAGAWKAAAADARKAAA